MPFATVHRTVQAKNFLKTGIPPVRPAGFPNLLKPRPSCGRLGTRRSESRAPHFA